MFIQCRYVRLEIHVVANKKIHALIKTIWRLPDTSELVLLDLTNKKRQQRINRREMPFLA